MVPESTRPGLLVLASTYPRWKGDPEPGFVHELSRRLTPWFDVSVLCPASPGVPAEEVMDGVRVVRYRYGPDAWQTLVNDGGMLANVRRQPLKLFLLPAFFLGQLWAIRRLVRQTRPAVIHAHWLIPQGLALAVLGSAGVRLPPFLVTSHGADLFALRSGMFRRLKRFVLGRATGVTVVSSAMVREMQAQHLPTDGVAVEPMGVDLAGRFVPCEPSVRIPGRMLFVGRLVPKKGLRHLLDALPAILARRPDAVLEIVGFGPEEHALRARREALGIPEHAVVFRGAIPQPELPDVYRRAAVFVAPFVATPDGDQEGLGLVMVEAAGCGCPIVAGDVPAVRDVIGDPVVGRIVPAEQTGQLADAVLEAMAEGADAPALQAARVATIQSFDWGRRAEAYARRLFALVQG